MCKTIKSCFDELLTFDKLLAAHRRASLGKRSKKEVILFDMDLETNLIRIYNDLKEEKYSFGEYREFIVYEPKMRIIKSLPYRDRVVHQWYVEEFIKPYFYPRFTQDTCACLENRGTHYAAKKTQGVMRKMKRMNPSYYVLKCDVKKYFYSIDKKILMHILSEKIKDQKLLRFTEKILDDGNDIGIPIGNYTSQYFANIYLNELDYYVKYDLKVKYYIRYMDDFVLLVDSKEEAKALLESIRKFLKEKLNLELNAKSKYFPSHQGIDFCGYRIYETHILLRKRFKKKLKKSMRLWEKLKREGHLDYHRLLLAWNSYRGHASHSNSYNYINKQIVKYYELYQDD